MKDLHVIYKRTLGNYHDLNNCWTSLVEKNAYYDDTTVMIEKFYNTPAVATRDNSICDLCFTITEPLADENTMIISGSKYAVCPYQGTIEGIFRVMQGFFRIWLPESDYHMREKYGLTIYRAIDWENGFCCEVFKT